MKENIQQMRARHKDEINELRSECEHKESRKMKFEWAPGHFGEDVEVCDFCEKILRSYPQQDSPVTMSSQEEIAKWEASSPKFK